jgi:hypothetical protein
MARNVRRDLFMTCSLSNGTETEKSIFRSEKAGTCQIQADQSELHEK